VRARSDRMADALVDPVGCDRKSEPACEGRSSRQSERAQPRTRCEARQSVEEELEDVPAADKTEHRAERPEEDPVRPAGEVRLRLRIRPDAVRVAPGSVAVLELVADEPVVVEHLKVVRRRRY